jgi:hypothetical protein
VAARQAERKLEESKQEASQLRNRLIIVEKNALNTSKTGETAAMNDSELTFYLFIYFVYLFSTFLCICVLDGFRLGWKGNQFTFVQITREKTGVLAHIFPE